MIQFCNYFLFLCLSENVHCEKARVEILPTQSVQRKPVGKSMLLTCSAKVDNPDLISDLKWYGDDNMPIRPKE